MYIDLTNCYDQGIVFADVKWYDTISFVNNSAGNSIYFNIPDSCSVINDYSKDNSAAYFLTNYITLSHIALLGLQYLQLPLKYICVLQSNVLSKKELTVCVKSSQNVRTANILQCNSV